jgi:hypothetical protein
MRYPERLMPSRDMDAVFRVYMAVRRPLGVAVSSALLLAGCGRVGYELIPTVRAGKQAGNPMSGGSDAAVDASGSGASGAGGGGAGGASAGGRGGTTLDASRSRPDAAPFDAAPACTLVPLTLTDWCTEIPELAAAPVIDGALDCPLALRSVVPLGFAGTGTPDAVVDYAIAWFVGGLYFYVAVHDPVVVPAAPADPVWEGDAVELFVDDDGAYTSAPLFDAVGTRQFVVGAPPSARAAVYSQGAGANVPWTSTAFAARSTSDGYAVEALVSAADLGRATWTLASRANVGFDLAIDASYPTATQTGAEGHRLGQYFLHLATGVTEPYRNVAAFCNPKLVAR